MSGIRRWTEGGGGAKPNEGDVTDAELELSAHFRPVQGGVPAWLAGTLNYCSRCGTELRFGPIDG